MGRAIRTMTGLAVAASVAATALAQTAATQPAGGALLEQLERETQSLYSQVQASVVRVQLPPPLWVQELAQRENPINKWGKELSPEVRRKLEEHMHGGSPGELRTVNATVAAATTQPAADNRSAATAPAPAGGLPPVRAPGALSPGGTVTFLAPVRVGPSVQWQPVTLTFASHIGVILDEDGHVLVPLYVEKDVVGDRRLPVTMSDGQTLPAKFVGSDRMLNVTVLQMEKPAGRPARFAPSRPAEGSLVLMLSPNAPGARLEVWTGGHQEMGLVVGMDGRFSGFSRFGHFLELEDSRPTVEQLVKYGVVKRAQLGVWVQEVPKGDPTRQQVPLLNGRPALRVLEVTQGSAAEQAGLRVNDLILTLAGKAVGDTMDFALAISTSSGPTELRIIRDGQEQAVRVDLKPQ